jgi:hypothetical protein
MTTDMVIFLDAKRGVRATVVIGGAAPIRAGRDVCLDGEAIVATGEKLYENARRIFSPRAQIFLKPVFGRRKKRACCDPRGLGFHGKNA